MAWQSAPDPLFRRMLYNRGITLATIGVLLAVGGAIYSIYHATRSQSTPDAMLQASKMDMGIPNQEDEFHRQVAELTQSQPGGAPAGMPGTFPYGIVAAVGGIVFIGIGAYQMRMARS